VTWNRGSGDAARILQGRLLLGAGRMGCQVVTRRNGNRNRDLALAKARIEAVFGPVKVLEVRPNPHPAGHSGPEGNQAREETAQAVLDLDGQQQKGVRRSPGAVDARPGG
jgi:hypothetical protein